MTIQINRTLRTMLVATVATSFLLAACTGRPVEPQQAKVTGELRAPQNNPSADNMADVAQADGLRAPQSNPTTVVGEEYNTVPVNQQPQVMPAQTEKPGLFSWMWDKPQQQVDTSQRRVPALNQNATAQPDTMATASYQPSAPVGDVNMAPPADGGIEGEWMAPQKDVIIAEEVVVMDEPFAKADNSKTFPSLASVPARPDRLNALDEKDARMADMQAARTESAAQGQQLNAQMASDMGEQSELDAEFAALVATPESPMTETPMPETVVPQEEEIQVVQESAPAVVVEAPAQAAYQPLPDAAPMATAQQPAAQSWEPVPMVEPQTAMTAQPAQPIQQDQWVSLQQDPAMQMAVPVEGVMVDGAPQVAAVSAIPVMPAGSGADGIQLVPPSAHGAAVRTLPESRYAARRQAVYMQRYARQPQPN